MNRKSSYALLALMALVLVVGCTHRMIDFTIISSKNVDLSKADQFTRGHDRITGEDTAYIIIIIPTGVPHMKEAVDQAIEKVPGAVALVDGVISQKMFYFPLIYGYTSFVVEGTPLIDEAMVMGEAPESNYMLSYYDSEEDDQKLVYLTRDEYDKVQRAVHDDDGESIQKLLQKN